MNRPNKLMKNEKSHLILSVVIPAYNGAPYIQRCMESVLCAKSRDIEVICVDDGSTDETARIYKKIMECDTRCRYVYQRNEGLVSARERGIKKAIGDYIAFIDVDDYVDSDYIDICTQNIAMHGEDDIIIFKMVEIIDGNGGGHGKDCNERIMNQRVAIREMFEWNYYRWELAGKAYRRSLLIDDSMDRSITICEDLDRNWNVFHRANTIRYLPRSNYYYEKNNNGMTNVRSHKGNTSWRVLMRILSDSQITNEEIGLVLPHAKGSVWSVFRGIYIEDLFEYSNVLAKLQEAAIQLNKIQVASSIDEYGNLLPESMSRFIDDNRRKIRDAIIRHKKNKKLFVYGVGAVARYIASICRVEDIPIEGFVVSDGFKAGQTFFGRIVWDVSSYKNAENNMIILALNKYNRAIVKRGLDNKGIYNYFEVESDCLAW